MIADFQLAVPANLLLLGEYAVTEEGGLGFSLAVDRRLKIRFEGRGPFCAVSVFKSGTSKPVDLQDHTQLVSYILAALSEKDLIDVGSFAGTLTIDSSAFFSADGKKMGFGSSAAVTLGVCAAALRLANAPLDSIDVPGTAHGIHKAFQRGRGSGYDIYTSYRGGSGVFTGGGSPRFDRLDIPWLPPMYVKSFERPVKSGSAVSAYTEWKRRDPEGLEDFLDASNATVTSFAKSQSWDTARGHLIQGRDLGLSLGENIGVSAEIPSGEAGTGAQKCVGAGNELAVSFEDLSPSWTPLEINTTGLVWL